MLPPAPIPAAEKLAQATQLVARLLARRKPNSRPEVAVQAMARALVATPPASDHGRLLAATIKTLAAPGLHLHEPDQIAVWWLCRRGDTPSAGAVAGRLTSIQARDANARLLLAEAGEIAAKDGPRAAEGILPALCATQAMAGSGPSWPLPSRGPTPSGTR